MKSHPIKKKRRRRSFQESDRKLYFQSWNTIPDFCTIKKKKGEKESLEEIKIKQDL